MTTLSPGALRDWLVNYAATSLSMGKEDIPLDANFDTYGLDSVEVIVMAGVMEEAFEIEIDPSWFFDDPTINGVVAILGRRLAQEEEV
ncbi:acyl carrier protein [Aquabacter sp. L1I39]|uniref:acyl carrier protein n=1 Tax=Aquabacter sp. L1I39 TaxID=2820278 RepID=UPI001ADBC865|nr:acyl carrier protein [Aquabacter sp. L1I39]QTL02152.1 acyl carrier protein [Aquabacter sp. L1I39]